MKKILSILFTLTVLIVIISCKKTKDIIPNKGSAGISINDEYWNLNSVQGQIRDGGILSVRFTIYKVDAFNQLISDEGLRISFYRNENQQTIYKGYEKYPNATFITATRDGDVNNDVFYVLESDSSNNWIQVLEQQDDYRYIKGEFSLTLYRDQRGVDPSRFPDTLRIRNATFDVTFD